MTVVEVYGCCPDNEDGDRYGMQPLYLASFYEGRLWLLPPPLKYPPRGCPPRESYPS